MRWRFRKQEVSEKGVLKRFSSALFCAGRRSNVFKRWAGSLVADRELSDQLGTPCNEARTGSDSSRRDVLPN